MSACPQTSTMVLSVGNRMAWEQLHVEVESIGEQILLAPLEALDRLLQLRLERGCIRDEALRLAKVQVEPEEEGRVEPAQTDPLALTSLLGLADILDGRTHVVQSEQGVSHIVSVAVLLPAGELDQASEVLCAGVHDREIAIAAVLSHL